MSPPDTFVLKHELCLQTTREDARKPLTCATFCSSSFYRYLHLSLPAPAPKGKKLPLQAFQLFNADFLWLPSTDKTVKLWKVSERDKRPEGYNLKDEEGRLRDPATITTLRVSPAIVFCPCPSASLAARVRARGSKVSHVLAATVGCKYKV